MPTAAVSTSPPEAIAGLILGAPAILLGVPLVLAAGVLAAGALGGSAWLPLIRRFGRPMEWPKSSRRQLFGRVRELAADLKARIPGDSQA